MAGTITLPPGAPYQVGAPGSAIRQQPCVVWPGFPITISGMLPGDVITWNSLNGDCTKVSRGGGDYITVDRLIIGVMGNGCTLAMPQSNGSFQLSGPSGAVITWRCSNPNVTVS